MLKSMDVEKEVVTRDGQKVKKYLSYGVSAGDLSNLKKDIIRSVHSRTERTSTSALVSDSKDSWLYTDQPFGEPLDFCEYWESVLNGVQKENREHYDSNAPEISEYESYGERND